MPDLDQTLTAKITDVVRELLEDAAQDYDHDDLAGLEVRTFAEAGVLTRDDGLVLRWDDGDEIQVTLVQSRYAS